MSMVFSNKERDFREKHLFTAHGSKILGTVVN